MPYFGSNVFKLPFWQRIIPLCAIQEFVYFHILATHLLDVKSDRRYQVWNSHIIDETNNFKLK